jgi:hypothetical protein
VRYQIETLGGGILGLTVLGSSVVTLDATAAGYGWFVDPNVGGDSAFGSAVTSAELRAAPGSPAFNRMDLLTVVEHELGHVLGLSDLDPQAVPHDLLTTTLGLGVRRLPTPTVGALASSALATPEVLPARLAVQASAAPLVIPPAAAASAPAGSLVVAPVSAAEVPAGPLVVTVPSSRMAGAAPVSDGSLPGAGGAQSSPGLNAVAPAVGGPLPPSLGQPLAAASVFAPLLPGDRQVWGESAVTVLPARKTDWLHAVDTVPAEGDPAAEARNALFARLGDQEALPELLGDDRSAW